MTIELGEPIGSRLALGRLETTPRGDGRRTTGVADGPLRSVYNGRRSGHSWAVRVMPIQQLPFPKHDPDFA